MAEKRRAEGRPVALAVVATVLVGAIVGWINVRHWNETLTLWEARISSLATERQRMIATWLAERRGDAELLAAYPSVHTLLEEPSSLSGEARRKTAAHLGEVLKNFLDAYGYAYLAVFDPEEDVVAEVGQDVPVSRLNLAKSAQVAMDAGDFCIDQLWDTHPHLWMVFAYPVVTSEVSSDQRIVGAVTLLVDPQRALIPAITDEDVPTRTGETVLMTRRGEDALFLSPLRGVTGAGPVRRPLTTVSFAARAALAGEHRVGWFTDYRGVPVLAATRRIDRTGWGLVVKIDRDEAFQDYRNEMWLTTAGGALLVLAFAGFVLASSRRQQARELAAELAQERVLRNSRERYRLLSDNANDIVLFVAADGRIAEANCAAATAYGYSRNELVTMSLLDLCPPGSPANDLQLLPMGAQGITFETEHRRRDGSIFPLDVSAVGTDVDGSLLFLCIIRDISGRKQQVQRIERLQGILAALREVNQMLVRETDSDRLLQRTCDIVQRARAYRMAWVGVPEVEGKRVRPVASAGNGTEDLPSTVITWDDTPTGQGPTGIALRTGRLCVIRSIQTDQRTRLWRPTALRLGYASVVALPLRYEESLYGVLSVYAALVDAFDPEETGMLEELADDIGHALHRLALRAENIRVTERVRASEERYRRLNAELEQRVRERTAQLEATNKELEAFSSSVSHDLRAPLRAVEGFSRALLEEFADQLGVQGRHYLQRVRGAAANMGNLINDLLSLSRVARSEMSDDVVDLSALARGIADELQRTQPDRQVEFVIAPELTARGDIRLLRLVLENLLANAWKYTNKHATARIELGTLSAAEYSAHAAARQSGGDHSAIADLKAERIYFVRDDGAGFDPAYADRLFAPFQRLHAATEFEGTGIGLATVGRIIHRHGGRVWAQGAVEKGAAFYFTL